MRIEFSIDPNKLRNTNRRKQMAGIAKEPSLRQNLILAYHIESILSERKAKDLNEIAGWLNMGRTRLFQVTNLLLLAPSIQEEIIFAHNSIIKQTPEYKTREIVNEPIWDVQRKMWSSLLSKTSLDQNR